MESAGWEIVEEPELRRFLRGARPDWRASDLAAAESKLRRVDIEDVDTLLQALTVVVGTRVVLHEMFETEDIVPFSTSTMEALREQAKRPLPRARTSVQQRGPEERQEEPERPRPFARFFEGEEGEQGQGEGTAEQAPRQRGPRPGRCKESNPMTLREKRLEACRRQGAAAAAAEIEAAWRDSSHEQDETFEVLAREVHVREAPREEAPAIGVLRQGEFVQVRPRRLWDADDHEWVELSYLELLRSCPVAGNGAALLGYALIDASHLGQGRLLRGPISRAARPDPTDSQLETAAEAVDEGGEGAAPAAGPDNAPLEPPAPPTAPEVAPAAALQCPQEECRGPAPKQKPKSSAKVPKLNPQLFTVSHPGGVAVREGPSASELQVCWLEEGASVELEEETFDGWAKLVAEGGWVRRRALQGDAVVTYLSPMGKPPLLAGLEVSAEPGPRRFEVVFRPRLGVKAAPRPTARLLGSKDYGESVFALTQTYDGWVRLSGDGWMPGIGRESGQMLR